MFVFDGLCFLLYSSSLGFGLEAYIVDGCRIGTLRVIDFCRQDKQGCRARGHDVVIEGLQFLLQRCSDLEFSIILMCAVTH